MSVVLSFSLSAFNTRNTERERENEITFKGRFSAAKFSKCVARKDVDDDGHSLLAERRNAKDQNGKKERERNAREKRRDENLFFCARKKRVRCAFISTIRTFFMRHFERNLGEKRDSWLHDEECTVARSNQERRVCVLFS